MKRIHSRIHRKKGGTRPYKTDYSGVTHNRVRMSVRRRTQLLQKEHDIEPTDEEKKDLAYDNSLQAIFRKAINIRDLNTTEWDSFNNPTNKNHIRALKLRIIEDRGIKIRLNEKNELEIDNISNFNQEHKKKVEEKKGTFYNFFRKLFNKSESQSSEKISPSKSISSNISQSPKKISPPRSMGRQSMAPPQSMARRSMAPPQSMARQRIMQRTSIADPHALKINRKANKRVGFYENEGPGPFREFHSSNYSKKKTSKYSNKENNILTWLETQKTNIKELPGHIQNLPGHIQDKLPTYFNNIFNWNKGGKRRKPKKPLQEKKKPKKPLQEKKKGNKKILN